MEEVEGKSRIQERSSGLSSALEIAETSSESSANEKKIAERSSEREVIEFLLEGQLERWIRAHESVEGSSERDTVRKAR